MTAKALTRVKRADRIAAFIIRIGGILVVCAVIGILFVILNVALPLFFPASVEPRAEIAAGDLPEADVLAAGVGEYFETAYVIDDTGTITMYALPEGDVVETVSITKPDGANRVAQVSRMPLISDHAISWDNGAATLVRVTVRPQFDEEGERSLARKVEELAVLDPLPSGPPRMLAASVGEDDSSTRVALTPSGSLTIEQVTVSTSFLNEGERTTTTQTIDDVTQGSVTAITLNTDGTELYVGSSEGYLGRWDLSEPGAAERVNHFKIGQNSGGIADLAMIFGDISVAVSDSNGAVSTWFPVATEDGGGRDLREIHVFPEQSGGVEAIVPSRHDKSFYTLSGDGVVRGWHMTSERLLLDVPRGTGAKRVGLSKRGNGLAVIESDGDLAAWSIDAPHPETSMGTLFGPVWYENYPEPSLTWQSSSSSDDFEPKLSLVPLIFGSFKGTIYAMIFAVPLALFGAVYTSQFAANSVSGTVKAAIEIMAAIPSVVIGFLAALWFAPILDNVVLPVLLALPVFPVVLIAFVGVWHPFRESNFAKRVGRGYEFVVAFPVLLIAGVISLYAGQFAESVFFDGNFQQWLFDSTGEVYDQRNSIVIAFALGFAVVPLIFTIAEDAISNVPFGLRAASLALGASRWQTVWRVVLPSASPGIFAAMIIGFGRAVGETMIVLMATGNTPILDVSPFNGMRTLSANIAVEIPEAPVDGTLYRVLFLSAVLLLILTSILNTAAELIRQRLRKKYGQFH